MTATAPERECDCAMCVPELYDERERGRHIGDLGGGRVCLAAYPAARRTDLRRPGTCVVQNLAWLREHAPPLRDEAAWERVAARYGCAMPIELQALDGIRRGIEEPGDLPGCPFLVVCRGSWTELCRAATQRRDPLLGEWRRWRDRAVEAGERTSERIPIRVFRSS